MKGLRDSIRVLASQGDLTRLDISDRLGVHYATVVRHTTDICVFKKSRAHARSHERNWQILVVYLENHTLDEVGQRFGITRERVRQILNAMGVRPRSFTHITFPKPPKRTQTFSERFWALVNKNPGQGPEGDCWEFVGPRWPSRYGRFASSGKVLYAHRLAYLLSNRKALKNMCCHHCDNPPCCNPTHLYDGTALNNARDRQRRGLSCFERRRLVAMAA